MKPAVNILLVVLLFSTLPIGCWWVLRCNCKDGVVLGHSVSTSGGMAVGGGTHQLHVRGVDQYDSTECVRIVDVGFQTYMNFHAGDSIHFKEDPISL